MPILDISSDDDDFDTGSPATRKKTIIEIEDIDEENDENRAREEAKAAEIAKKLDDFRHRPGATPKKPHTQKTSKSPKGKEKAKEKEKKNRKKEVELEWDDLIVEESSSSSSESLNEIEERREDALQERAYNPRISSSITYTHFLTSLMSTSMPFLRITPPMPCGSL